MICFFFHPTIPHRGPCRGRFVCLSSLIIFKFMKSFIPVSAISFVIILSVQSCLTCTKCKRNDLEAKCIKTNDTLIFNQDSYTEVHRYYSGGDSIFNVQEREFNYKVEQFTDSGYTCSVYATGHVSEVRGCNEAGEHDDSDYEAMRNYEHIGYTCHEYKGP